MFLSRDYSDSAQVPWATTPYAHGRTFHSHSHSHSYSHSLPPWIHILISAASSSLPRPSFPTSPTSPTNPLTHCCPITSDRGRAFVFAVWAATLSLTADPPTASPDQLASRSLHRETQSPPLFLFFYLKTSPGSPFNPRKVWKDGHFIQTSFSLAASRNSESPTFFPSCKLSAVASQPLQQSKKKVERLTFFTMRILKPDRAMIGIQHKLIWAEFFLQKWTWCMDFIHQNCVDFVMSVLCRFPWFFLLFGNELLDRLSDFFWSSRLFVWF